jgi:hypothetical protein
LTVEPFGDMPTEGIGGLVRPAMELLIRCELRSESEPQDFDLKLVRELRCDDLSDEARGSTGHGDSKSMWKCRSDLK